MRRALFFLIKLAILIALAVWLANRPGRVEIAWGGYVVETSVAVLALAGLALAIVAALGYRLWRALAAAPARVGRARALQRRERGYRALTQGMVAVAAGDPEGARSHARRADVLLDEPPLTLLLAAQAAQLNGDEGAAQRYFEAMLERPETAFLGLRGLITQAWRSRDWQRAQALAQRARALKPDAGWLLDCAFELEVRLGKWDEAEATLARAARVGAMPEDAARRHRAAVLLERARQAERAGNAAGALVIAQRAAAADPANAPAALIEARLLARDGKDGRARAALERAWAARPHRRLAEAYADLAPQGEDALARVKRLERFAKQQPESADGLIVLGEAALQAKLWGPARTHLARAEQLAPDRRVYRLLARLETAERGDPGAGRDWLIKAEAAQPEPAWVCDSCGGLAPDWTALCPHCGAFDRMAWRVPTVALHRPAAPELLPAGLALPTTALAASAAGRRAPG